MTEIIIEVPPLLDSLLKTISTNIDQAESKDVIQELERRYPNRKDSFDRSNLYGAFKQLYVMGAIDDDGDQKVLEILLEETSKYKEVVELVGDYKKASSRSSQRKDDCVGREDDVNKILKRLKNPDVPGVNLFGESGVGKTTLAKEVSKRSKSFDCIFVDLRNVNCLKNAYFHILQALHLPAWDDYKKERIYKFLENLNKKTFLIFDSIEQFLSKESQAEQETRADFLEFLKVIIGSEASKKEHLKVILTSTTRLNEPELKGKFFTEYNVQPFSKDVSKDFISKRIRGDVKDALQDRAMCEIADLCRNTPYLLQEAEQLMRESFASPVDVLRKINAQKEKGVPEEFACISALFESLPNDHLKQVAVKISLLRRPFSANTAMKISEISSVRDAELDLEMLAKHKIITAIDAKENEPHRMMEKRKYDLHALFREFVTLYLCQEDPVYKEQLKKGEKMFFQHFSAKLTKLANQLEREFVKTYSKLEGNRANFELVINLSEENKETLDLLLHTDDHNQFALMGILFEVLKDEKERRDLFGKWAAAAEEQEQWFTSALMRCWQSIQGSNLEGKLNEEILQKAEMSIKKLQSTTPEKLNEVNSLFLHCQGKIKWMKAKKLTLKQRRSEHGKKLLKEGIKHFEKSVEMRKQMKTADGDSTLTARALNLIGNCYMELKDPLSAQKKYQQAMDMKVRLVGSKNHWEIPTYYNQMAEVHDMLGRKEEEKFFNRVFGFKGKARKEYEKAVEWLKKALALQEKLEVSDTYHTSIFQSNLANNLIGLKEYVEALKYAKKSFEIRNEHLGIHPETVRIQYLIGIIHEWKEDLEAALQSYEDAFAMEESLAEDNHSVVRKLLCNRLEAMCKKLKKKDKLEEYRPRMDKMRKIEDNPLTSQHSSKGIPDIRRDPFSTPDVDDDNLGVTEITISGIGGSYTISRMGVFLYFPSKAVDTLTAITCRVLPKDLDYPPFPAGADETLVSNIVELGPSDVDLYKPIIVSLMHSGPGRDLGYETVVKAFNQDKGVWEEIEEFKDKSHLPDSCERYYIGVQISKLTVLAVVTRLITDRFKVTPKGCVVRSSVCDDVTVEFPEGAVDKTVEGAMKVQLVDASLWKKENLYPFPILCVDGLDGVQFQKLPTVKLRQPSSETFSESKICVLCLEDSKTPNETENHWTDITEQVHIDESEDFIQLRVTHFSLLSIWKRIDISPIARMSSIFKYVRSTPRNVCFAAFKDNKESSGSFKLRLLCVDNIRLHNIKELPGYSEVNPITGDLKMRKDDKAYVKINGDFKQDESTVEPVILSFLGDDECEKDVYICKKEDIDSGGNEMLQVSFYDENHERCLCKLSYKAKDIPSILKLSIKVTPNINISDELKRRMVVDICLNKTLLSPLRDFLKQNMNTHYNDMKTQHSIHNQSHSKHLSDDNGKPLHYKNINNNKEGKKKPKNYDYNVKSAEDLGKLYLELKMAKFTGFDDTCDMSAVLGILSSASVFSIDVKNFAVEVRRDVRNPLSHCNFQEWTNEKFTSCFQLMKSLLVQALGLSVNAVKQIMEELREWETKGMHLLFGGGIFGADVKQQITKLLEESKDQETKDALDNVLKVFEKAAKTIS